MDSECVSCGACVQACPTATLSEKSLIEKGQAEHSITTTCAYCGVGCSFRAEMKGEEVVRMVPNKDGHANHGHSCVKGRFAIGYATHSDRIVKPMIRSKITDPWREVSWEEAIEYAASELKRIQAKYGRDSIGGITSSRCTNEETYWSRTRARRLRQQQRRHLRPRLSFAHRLRPEATPSANRPARRISIR
jgi:formate dehydrogenase major subunit